MRLGCRFDWASFILNLISAQEWPGRGPNQLVLGQSSSVPPVWSDLVWPHGLVLPGHT